MNYKKLLLTSSIALLLSPLAHADEKYVKGYCKPVFQEGTVGYIDVVSEHGFTIINNLGKTTKYRIDFHNGILYGKLKEMPLEYKNDVFTPNAHEMMEITLAPNQRYDYGTKHIYKPAFFPAKRFYKINAITAIQADGKILHVCINTDYIKVN